MKKYFLALLFVFASSPCFSTDIESVEELSIAYRSRIGEPQTPDEDLILFLEEKRKTASKIYMQFLNQKPKDEKEYPTHLAMISNRPQLLGYLLDNHAKLNSYFYKPMEGLYLHFASDALSANMIKVTHRGLLTTIGDSATNKFFTILYLNHAPKLIRQHQETFRELREYTRNSRVHIQELTDQQNQFRKTVEVLQEENTRAKEQRDRLNLEKQKLEEDFLQREKILQEMSEKLQAHANNLERQKEIIELFGQEKVTWLERQKKFTEEIETLTRENVFTKEQHEQLDLQYKRLEEDHLEKEKILLGKAEEIRQYKEKLEANKNSIKLLKEQKAAWLEEQERFTQRVKDLEKEYAELDLRHAGLQDTLLEKDNTLLQRDQTLEENRVAIERLNIEKDHLAEQYRQAVIRTEALENRSALFDKQKGDSEVQMKILHEKLLQKLPAVKEKERVIIIRSHEGSAHLPLDNSSLASVAYGVDSSAEETLPLFPENQQKNPLALATPQIIIEGNIMEQTSEARRMLSSEHTQKYSQLAAQQTKAKIAQTETLKQLKIEEEKANIAFEKNKRAEMARQLLELETESKRNRN